MGKFNADISGKSFLVRGGALQVFISCSPIGWYSDDKKRLASRIKPSLVLKIILYNTRTLQQIKFNQMKSYTKKDDQGT